VVPTVDELQPEIAPSQGVTVSSVTRGDTFQGAHTWWAIAVDVGRDAALGERTLTLRFPGGRASSTLVAILSHVPRIAELRILGTQSNPAALDVELAASDGSGDLGAAPYVWFTAACGDMPLPGVVRGTVAGTRESGSVIRASIPRPAPGRGTPGTATCDVRVRVADVAGFESNTLGTTLDYSAFGQAASSQTPPSGVSADTGGGDWEEIVSQEERFTALFPGRPVIHETTWLSQFGAVLPARVYSVSNGQRRYSLTVVDYNPVERLLVERSPSCPPGANTCQGIADWGVGYWKTDVRGALLYVISKFLERDAKATSVMWNGIALVQGVEMRLTNNADQSRTFASIYMHENRLLIVEATVPRGDAPPVAFNESINWLDERGRPVRYQATYVNIPDVPKPLPRGAPAPPASPSR
ncbi:MAG: hypothetical protein HW394_1870, partial [Acidobacteria bacterium]|nr:hypothetical protein [Acidobacteriota bacterium]